jgi:hypothetical protein
MKDGKLRVMSFGLGGNHGDGVSKDGNSYQSSWYLNGPDEFVDAIPSHYNPAEVDGCLVIDKREAVDKNPGLAVRAPLCDARLGDGAISRFNDKIDGVSSLMLEAFAQGNDQQRSLAAIAAYSLVAKIDGPGPLDYVSPTAYAAWWQQHGARVGVLHCEPEPRIEWAPAL